MPFATFLVALLAGMGVGSGGLYVVYLTLFAEKNQLAAQGLNLYFFIFATGAALLLHVRIAPFHWRRLAVLCAVGAAGCVFGATLAQSMSLDLLRRINRELNVTLVIITHSLSVARNICDRVAMIDGGRIVEMGDTEALFADPHSDILKTLIADAKVTNHRHTHETADGAKNGAADDSAQKEVK